MPMGHLRGVALVALAFAAFTEGASLRQEPLQPVPELADKNAASSAARVDLGDKTIAKSELDERQYRLIDLDNGLQVFLISDADATQSAAAMDVGNGYFSDPEDSPGLAHFLEHMLFLGTKKYPSEDAYETFLGKHGGDFNAYTSQENTNFYFDIQPAYFEKTLDRFAQFFISPMLTESATGREMKAVDAEHSKNLQNDGWRFEQVKQTLANKKSPFHKFGTGNLDTLNAMPHKEMRARLVKDWESYFVAENLKLSILDKAPLDDMEKSVRKMFAGVPSSGKPFVRSFSQTDYLDLYPEDVLKSRIFFEPVEDSRTLSLFWTVPPQGQEFMTRSSDYIEEVFGSTEEGSLLAILKGEGLVTDVSVGMDTDSDNFGVFTAQFELTPKGLKKTDYITAVFYKYLGLVKKSGVEEWRFNEIKALSALGFDHKSKEDAADYVQTMSSRLRYYPKKLMLTGGHLLFDFDEDKVHALLALLTPDRMFQFVVAKGVDKTCNLSEMEPWYKIPYGKEPIPAATLKLYAEGNKQINALEMKLPAKNPFVPQDMSIKPACEWPNGENPKHPVIIHEGTEPYTSRLWFKQDTTFKRPLASIHLRLWSPLPHATPRSVVLTGLWISLFGDTVEPLDYLPAMAGFSYDLSLTRRGLNLGFAGYSDGLYEYALRTAKYIRNPPTPFTEHQFELIKRQEQEGYANEKFSKPYSWANSIFGLVTRPDGIEFQSRALAAALNAATLEDVIAHGKTLWADVQVEGLAHGNILPSEAEKLFHDVNKALNFKTVSASIAQSDRKNHMPVGRLAQLNAGEQMTITTQMPNPDEENSAVLHYFQATQGSQRDGFYAQILSQVCEKPIYEQLRTAEQLGYIVWSMDQTEDYVSGFAIEVQSAKKTAAYVGSRIEAFLPKLRKHVMAESHKDFDGFVATLVHANQQPYTTMSEQTAAFWDEILSGELRFNRRAEAVTLLQDKDQINIEGFNKFFDTVFQFDGEHGNRVTKTLNIHVTAGSKHAEKKGEGELKTVSLMEVDAQAKLYSDHKLAPVPDMPAHVTVKKACVPTKTSRRLLAAKGATGCSLDGSLQVAEEIDITLDSFAKLSDRLALFPTAPIADVVVPGCVEYE